MQRARMLVDDGWNDERARVVERGLRRRRRTRRALRVAAGGLAVALSCVLFLLRMRGASSPASRDVAVAATAPTAIATTEARLGDGSTVSLLEPGALVQWKEVTPTGVAIALERGSIRCDVMPDPRRVFRVQAGELTVEVLGTAFRVERVGHDQARVVVERGRVRVRAPGRTTELRAGEGDLFPTESPVAPVAPEVTAAEAITATAEPAMVAPAATAGAAARATEPSAPASSWRSLAARGAFDEAYAAVRRDGSARAVADDVAELLLFADVARNSHHPEDAVVPLRAITASHRADPRASLAAFTLGRVLLDELGRASEASAAFADARTLAPDGVLACDALAREVEARARAGDARMARTLAERYVREYPTGARLHRVRHYGGLE
jgi:transmembrane sensor